MASVMTKAVAATASDTHKVILRAPSIVSAAVAKILLVCNVIAEYVNSGGGGCWWRTRSRALARGSSRLGLAAGEPHVSPGLEFSVQWPEAGPTAREELQELCTLRRVIS